MRPEQAQQGGAVSQPVQARDRVERSLVRRQGMRLPVLDHLQPVLDGAEQPVGVAQRRGILGRDPPRRRQRRQRVLGPGGAQLRLASAMDELVDLGEELDLADAAGSATIMRRGRPSAPATT